MKKHFPVYIYINIYFIIYRFPKYLTFRWEKHIIFSKSIPDIWDLTPASLAVISPNASTAEICQLELVYERMFNLKTQHFKPEKYLPPFLGFHFVEPSMQRLGKIRLASVFCLLETLENIFEYPVGIWCRTFAAAFSYSPKMAAAFQMGLSKAGGCLIRLLTGNKWMTNHPISGYQKLLRQSLKSETVFTEVSCRWTEHPQLKRTLMSLHKSAFDSFKQCH